MKTNPIAAILILLCMVAANATAQYQTVTTSGTAGVTISIPAGQVMQVFNFTHDSAAGVLRLTKGPATEQIVFQSVSAEGSTGRIARESYFAGPAKMWMAGGSEASKLCLSYRLFDNSAITGTTVPSTAVVIPAESAGPVTILLESSTDLITWTAAAPGSYGSSTTKRFFRVRAVAQ